MERILFRAPLSLALTLSLSLARSLSPSLSLALFEEASFVATYQGGWRKF